MLPRAAVTAVAGALVVAAEIAAVLSPSPFHHSRRERPIASLRAISPVPEPGEPELPPAANASLPARSAAAAFVRDYALWSSHRARTFPGDTTRRVLVTLEHEGRRGAVQATTAAAFLRIAPASAGIYVATSAIGNFLVGRNDRGG
jgi:hypothetical protein